MWTGQQTDLDTLVGGAGNDIYFVDRFNRTTDVGDRIVELPEEGTDTVFYSGTNPDELTYVLGENLENLTLGLVPSLLPGFDVALNGIGNAEDNIILGNTGTNIIVGKGGADTLSGDQIVPGLDNSTDVFGYRTLTDSLLANFDTIQEFNIAQPGFALDQFGVTEVVFATLAGAGGPLGGGLSLGNAGSLDPGAIGSVLSNTVFTANQVGLFTVGTSRLFVAINNATAGYQSNADAIIELTGVAIGPLTLANFVTLSPDFA